MTDAFKPDRREAQRAADSSDRRRFLRPTGSLKLRGALIAVFVFAVICGAFYFLNS